MKVIIAGTRYKDKANKISFDDYKLVAHGVERSGYEITEVVCGMAIGVDKLGEQYARMKNIPVKEMPANWGMHGKAAGPIRNRQMAKYADAAVVVWDGVSPGSRNMINEMIRLNKPYYVVMTESEDTPPE
jgi:hypothetical protein